MTTRPLTRLAALACAVSLVLALAACGSSDDGGDDGGGSSAKTTTTAKTDDTGTGTDDEGAAVQVGEVEGFGSLLVDSEGMTLYTLTDEDGKAVACKDDCLDAWPPSTVPPGFEAGEVGGVEIDSTDGPDGPILTAGGLPLYLFAGDGGSGQAGGEGISSFGGTWHIVQAEGDGDSTTTTTDPGEGAPAGSDTPTTTSGDDDTDY